MTGLAAPSQQWQAHDSYAVFEFDSILEVNAAIAALQFFLSARPRRLFGGWGNHPRVLREGGDPGPTRLLLNDSACEAAEQAQLSLPPQHGVVHAPDYRRCDLVVG